MSDTCKIVIVYEDTVARARGMMVSERLAERFGEDLDFEFKWWSFHRLASPEHAMRTKVIAAAADIVLFCPRSTELPSGVSEWLESWSEVQSHADAAMAVVLTEPQGKPEALKRLIKKFEAVAQRMGMDFLQLAAPVFASAEPITQTVEPPMVPPIFNTNIERSHNYHWGLND
jgi:hypothetical protein